MKDWMVQIFNLTHVNICFELLLCIQHRFNLTAVFPLWSLTGRDWSIRAQRRGRPGGAKGSCWTPRWGWSYWTDWWEGMNCLIIFYLYLGSETSIYLNFSKYLRVFYVLLMWISPLNLTFIFITWTWLQDNVTVTPVHHVECFSAFSPTCQH